MLSYLLPAAVVLGLMAALPVWDPSGFGASPFGIWLLLVVAILAGAFRRRAADES